MTQDFLPNKLPPHLSHPILRMKPRAVHGRSPKPSKMFDWPTLLMSRNSRLYRLVRKYMDCIAREREDLATLQL
jgi:hypothetical protein